MRPVTLETPRGTILIREATPADATQYRDLRLFALQDSPTAFSGDYQASLNRPFGFWEERLTFDDHAMIFFAEHGNNLIGTTGISQRQSPKTKHSGEVFGVYVRPEWRGLRIAEALIEACVSWAKAHAVNILKLGVNTSNTSAIRSYERCGFQIYGTEPRDIFYDGQYYDLHLMYRELA